MNPERIHCIVLLDVDTNEEWTFASGLGYAPLSKAIELLRSADYLVAHNGIGFDVPVLNRLLGVNLDFKKVIDTLVVARTLNSWDYSSHSLEDWGERLGFPKTEFTDFSVLSHEMVQYCRNDVLVTKKLFELFKDYIFDEKYKSALRLEHDTARIFEEMHENGFGFDVERARELRSSILEEKSRVDEALGEIPARVSSLGEVLPKATQSGKISLVNFKWLTSGTPEENGYTISAPFTRIAFEQFNPASPKQRIDVLNQAGWKPFEKTKGYIKALKDKSTPVEKLKNYETYGWTLSEANLETLPPDAPQSARSLKRWILLDRRVLTLTEWIDAYRPETGKIHGRVFHIGAWTHRVAHSNPNTGNIVRVQHGEVDGKEVPLFGEEGGWGADFRSLWKASDGYKLIGCDAEGIQLRVLAHYMEEPSFTKALVEGKSKDGTDPHTMNMKKLNSSSNVCKSRNVAKTFVYAFLLGAGVGKVANILECSNAEAKRAVNDFIESYPGLKRLREEVIPQDAARGYFIGFDGRPVVCDSEYYMLAGYLQNGESVIMKTANRIWYQELKEKKIPFRQVTFVHDEYELEVPDEGDLPETAGQIVANSIRTAGEILKLKCPQAGLFRLGYSWLDVH